MKKTNLFFIIIFWIIIALPIIFFDRREDVVSEIDNRKLTSINSVVKDIKNVRKYVSDRLGFRSQAISIYTSFHDNVFHEMIHPLYEYGKDGYVFFKTKKINEFSDYHIEYANLVKKIQDYCDERGVPFLFVFNPAKTSIYPDKLKAGINYNNIWKDKLLEELDKRNINYIDNSIIIKEKADKGEKVFNIKYNAGHWNDLGAYYGVNNLLKKLNSMNINVKPHDLSEYKVEQKLNTSLPASNFAIHEYEPIFEPKVKAKYLTNTYRKYVKVNDRFRYFAYTKNEEADNDIRALIFQGSYMNSMGYKFTTNAFKELVAVHDYQNVADFNYYFNIFQPDVVIFETAEYTLIDKYYSKAKMKNAEFNPVLSSLKVNNTIEKTLGDLIITVTNDKITSITIDSKLDEAKYLYLKNKDKIYDFIIKDGKIYLQLISDDFNIKESQIIMYDNKNNITIYK